MTKRELDWDTLRVFLAASRASSLRGASDQLGVNHATISRAILGLEKTLGTRLFERSSDGLTLTQPGEILMVHAEEIERQTLQISRKISGLDGEPSGLVRVSMPPALTQGFLTPLLTSFSKKYPEITIRIISTNKISDLKRQEADVSIRLAFKVEDDVVGRRLCRCVLGAFASPDYLAEHSDLTIGDGGKAHWIGWGSNNTWVKDTPFPNASIRHHLPDIQTQLEAAAAGLGMAWVPCFLGDKHKGLCRIPDVPVVPSRSIWLLLHGDLRNSARVRAFVDHTAREILARKSEFTT